MFYQNAIDEFTAMSKQVPSLLHLAYVTHGMVFMAEITELSGIPNSEMKEVRTFCNLPDSLTYPEITPVLFDNAKKFF